MAALEPAYRPRASYDIESIVVHIGQVLGSPNAARVWYGQLTDAVSLLCETPDLGRPFEDDRLALKDRLSFLVGKYRLFYSYSADTLTVWRVMHTTLDMDDHALIDLLD